MKWHFSLALSLMVLASITTVGTIRAQNLSSSPFNYPSVGLVLSPLVQGPNSTVYGTSDIGGVGNGSVFQVAVPAGTTTEIYAFCSVSTCTDGKYPIGGLVVGTDNNFYGTTTAGANATPGTTAAGGTVFKITPSGTLTTLYRFCSNIDPVNAAICLDGAAPNQLVLGSDGAFYGTTQYGGSTNNGTVFKITSDGVLTTLYNLCTFCAGGGVPTQGMVQATNGDFYGSTVGGGAQNVGTLFKITPAGVFTPLYSFCSQPNCVDGQQVAGSLVQGSDGNFYGVMNDGGANRYGSIFKLSQTGEFSTIYEFCAISTCTDGKYPQGGLVQAADGSFYGTTSEGGANNWGTLYKITADGTFTLLYGFCSQPECSDGESPDAGLLKDSNGNLYGTTTSGGSTEDGTIFSYPVGRAKADSTALSALVNYFGQDETSYSDWVVWRPSSGEWYILDPSGPSKSVQWGVPSDIPVVGDFDGDGKSDVTVWRPSTGTWYIIQSSNNEVITRQWGEASDIPVVGDFDGDGKSDIAVWRPSTGTWYIIQSSNNEVITRQWGDPTDVPVSGDFDGDGKTDIAVWRPSTGTWYVIHSSDNGVLTQQWGVPTDVPVPRDYDGDGKTDIAVWRPSSGTWYVIASRSGAQTATQWGASTDKPINATSEP